MDVRSDKLIRDVRVVVQDAEDLIRATAGEIGEQTREARARLAGGLLVARETCNRLERKAADRSRNADDFVRARPYQVVTAAFGIGLLAGALVARLSLTE